MLFQKLTRRLHDIALARIVMGKTVEGPKDVKETVQGQPY